MQILRQSWLKWHLAKKSTFWKKFFILRVIFGSNLYAKAQKTKVAKCFESESALFWPEKRQNAPWIFFSKNATIWEFFFENDWQYQFLLHFYVIIFSKYPKYNISQRFFNIFNWKISFWRFFLILLGAPNYFWRHKEFQKRHSGAKAPLLATLMISVKK